MDLMRRLTAEALGTAFLLAIVVGSGIMGAQLAAGNEALALLANALAHPTKARAFSAGTAPAERIHPEVVTVMRERGFDLTTAIPRHLTDVLAASPQTLITMGCGDACPVLPGVEREDWPLGDPQGQSLDQVRAIRDAIQQRVAHFVAAHGWDA